MYTCTHVVTHLHYSSIYIHPNASLTIDRFPWSQSKFSTPNLLNNVWFARTYVKVMPLGTNPYSQPYPGHDHPNLWAMFIDHERSTIWPILILVYASFVMRPRRTQIMARLPQIDTSNGIFTFGFFLLLLMLLLLRTLYLHGASIDRVSCTHF